MSALNQNIMGYGDIPVGWRVWNHLIYFRVVRLKPEEEIVLVSGLENSYSGTLTRAKVL